MRITRISIGTLQTALVAGLLAALLPVSAVLAQGALDDVPNNFEGARGTSPSFTLEQNTTWVDTNLDSPSFRLTQEATSSVYSSSSVSSPVGSTGGGGGATGGTTGGTGGGTGAGGESGGQRGNASSVAVAPAVSSVPAAQGAGSSRPRVIRRPAAPSATSQGGMQAAVVGQSTTSSESMASSASADGAAVSSAQTSSAMLAPCDAQLRPASAYRCTRVFEALCSGFGDSFPSTPLAWWAIFTAAAAGILAGTIFGTFAGKSLRSRRLWLFFLPLLFVKHEKKNDRRTKSRKTTKKRRTLRSLAILLVAAALAASVPPLPEAFAEQTVPALRVYKGRLLNAGGSPITTPHNVRFSYWKSADFVTTDLTGTGAINTSAPNFVLWQEVHTVTPDATGYFSLYLGSITQLPNLQNIPASTLLSFFLQVEVKAAASLDTSYELLDVNSSNASIDRSQVVSVPFARNADLLDLHDVGTGSGSIPVLGSGGTLWKAAIPGGTNGDFFTIDADDSAATSLALQFGTSLAKTLAFDISTNRFVFNDSLEIQGDLTVSGLINGVDITNLQSATGALKVASGGGLHVRVSAGSYRLASTTVNFVGSGSVNVPANTTSYVFFGSGGLTVNVAGFPSDESYIPLAEVTTNAGSVTRVVDRRALQSDDREQQIVQTFNPEFEKASYQGDGADNVGQMTIGHDNISLKNFYLWTTTRPTLQDYDIILRVPLSEDFVRWQTTSGSYAMTIGYRSTSIDPLNNKLDIQVYDTNGVPVTVSGTSTSLTSASWTTAQLNFGGNPTWTPGQDFLIKLHLSAKDAFQMHVGGITLRTINLTR
jgi:hypothetical protein